MKITEKKLKELINKEFFLKEKSEFTIAYLKESDLKNEQFEIFDENDKQITYLGKKLLLPRNLCHGEKRIKLFHRGANVFITKEDKLLVPSRAKNKDAYPNCKDVSVSEHLKIGETYEEAALRGIKEELGIEIKEIKELFKLKIIDKQNQEHSKYFLAKITEDKIILSSESSKKEWIEIKKLKDKKFLEKLNFRKDHFKALKKFLEEIQMN